MGTIYEYATKSWPIANGCSPNMSCAPRCWAIPQVNRKVHSKFPQVRAAHEGLVQVGAVMNGARLEWTGITRINEAHLTDPLRWRKPQRVAVAYHGDLFRLPAEQIDRVFAVMLACHTLDNIGDHQFLLLTKAADQMRRYFSERSPAELLQAWSMAGDGLIHIDGGNTWFHEYIMGHTCHNWDANGTNSSGSEYRPWGYLKNVWPLPNVWPGVSVTIQPAADERREALAALAAAGWKTWVSAEPQIGRIDWHGWDFLRWLVPGGESGANARAFDVQWMWDAILWAKIRGIPVFAKQLGAKPIRSSPGGATVEYLNMRDPKGSDPSEWPEDLRVREIPNPAPEWLKRRNHE